MKNLSVILALIPFPAIFAISDYQKYLLPALDPAIAYCYKECKKTNDLPVCDSVADELETHIRRLFNDAEKNRVNSSHKSFKAALEIMDPVCPQEKARFEKEFPK